jgi:hypothetical protein
VPIPVHVWEVIRAYTGVDLSWANWTDEELRAYVERRVDERQALVAGTAPDSVARLMGVLIYGDAEAPREEQIARGVRHVERERAHQRQIIAAIDELRQLIDTPPSPFATAFSAASDEESDERADESHPTRQQ